MSDGKRQTSPRIKSKRKTKPRKKAAISRRLLLTEMAVFYL